MKQVKNVQSERNSLGACGMWYNTRGRLDKYVDFKEEIQRMLGRKRGSELGTKSFQKLQDYIEENSTANENTYFGKFTDMLIGEERHVPTKKRDAEGLILEEIRSYKGDLAEPRRDTKFACFAVPGSSSPHTQGEIGMQDPKPDYTYGFKIPRQFLLGNSPSPNVRNLLEVCPGIWHPFSSSKARPDNPSTWPGTKPFVRVPPWSMSG